MQLFRKLAGNIFFKIILAFIALSFVMFGVSGFILGSPNSWVAKIGGKTISYSNFAKEMQKNREMILQSSKSEEAMKYLDSDQFKSDILNRMVNSAMIDKLREDLGAQASRKLILEMVAKSDNFKNAEGKFDRNAFKAFLAKNGLDEEKYFNMMQDEIVATMIIQTVSMSAPINDAIVASGEEFKQEKRFADVISISAKNVSNVAAPSAEEINKFFAENQKRYAALEFRKVSFLHFAKKDLGVSAPITDKEIIDEYEKNKEQFQRPESRNLYHILFDKEEDAKSFITKLDAASQDKAKIAAAFAKLAKELQNKDQKGITLNKVTQKDMIPDISAVVFKLAVNERSDAVKSPLGYHVFLLREIKKSEPISLTEVKDSIKRKLLEGREKKALQAKVSEVDDTILTSNSLSEVAKKFNLKAGVSEVKIDQSGQDENGNIPTIIASLNNFMENAFALKKGESSKLFFTKSGGYYAIKVEEITPAHDKKLEEVKDGVVADLLKSKKHEALQNLAKKIGDEVGAKPADIAAISAKYKVKLDKNKEFPRIFYINYQGHQIPYANKFLDELFSIKTGEATSVVPGGSQEFVIGVLKSIKKSVADATQVEQAKREAAENFRSEILQEYNAFLMKKYPIKINEKIMGAKQEK